MQEERLNSLQKNTDYLRELGNSVLRKADTIEAELGRLVTEFRQANGN